MLDVQLVIFYAVLTHLLHGSSIKQNRSVIRQRSCSKIIVMLITYPPFSFVLFNASTRSYSQARSKKFIKKFFTHPTATMSKVSPKERKQLLFSRTKDYFTQYSQFIIVGLNNVTSSQLQSAKQAWHGKAEFLFGKNTTVKKALRDMGHDDIVSRIFGNVAFIFTNGDVREIKQIVEDNKRNTFAKVGAIAQTDVWIEKKVTNMGPDKTSFFQALGISTKITKGKVEIIQNSKALTAGEKVTPSQANLLAIMDIQPFVYAMKMESIYGDKQFYEPWIADITDKDVEDSLVKMAQRATACALGMGSITKTTVPFDTKNALRKVVALSLAIGYDMDLAKPFK